MNSFQISVHLHFDPSLHLHQPYDNVVYGVYTEVVWLVQAPFPIREL